MKEKQAKQKK